MSPQLIISGEDALARAVYERVRRSLVEITRASDGTELRTLGVVTDKGGVSAWKGLLSQGGEWANTEDITLRQDGATWGVELHTYKADWGLCSLRVLGDFSGPVIRWRRSNTLFMGERLLYAVAGVGQEPPRLAWAQLTDVFAMKEKYNRPYIWNADLDPSMPLEYAFAFDSDGRVAGLLEPLPDLGPMAALLPGEWVGGLVERGWVDSLLELGALEQLVSEYRDDPDSYEAESLCAIGMALDVLGDKEDARQAFGRAAVKDPLNPWPHTALASLLKGDGAKEAEWCLRRAAQLASQEPEAPSSSTPENE